MREVKFRVWIVSDEYRDGIMYYSVFDEDKKPQILIDGPSQKQYGILINLSGFSDSKCS